MLAALLWATLSQASSAQFVRPCLHLLNTFSQGQSPNCPRPGWESVDWLLSCHPDCGYEQLISLSLTLGGSCTKIAGFWKYCPYRWESVVLLADSFSATGSDGIPTWRGWRCGFASKWTSASCLGCDVRPPCDDPLIISLSDNAYELTDAKQGVDFDLSGDGELERMPWTARGGDDAFLVLDRNDNGIVDSGVELFSHASPQPSSDSPNGFRALAVFDESQNGGNGDAKITEGDRIFASLRLWRDQDHDGLTDVGELYTLDEAGLKEIGLSYNDAKQYVDAHGNTFKYSAPANFAGGRTVDAWVVFFRLESCSSCQPPETD